MIYDFDYAMDRWKKEGQDNENGLLRYYYKLYKDIKPGTIRNYYGWLINLKFLERFLAIVGAKLPDDFDWYEIPEDETVCCYFEAKGDLSEYKISVYYEEKLDNNEPDYEIVNSKGSLTPDQFDLIRSEMSCRGRIEATVFLGYRKEINVDYFEELKFDDFVCETVVKL